MLRALHSHTEEAAPAALPVESPSRRDAAQWAAIVVAGLLLTALFVALRLPVGSDAAPFTGVYRWRVGPLSLLAPLVAVATGLAVRARWHERLAWRWLLVGGYAAALAWSLALALTDGLAGISGPLANPQHYLADVAAVGNDPLHFLRTFAADAGQHTIATRQHPPAPVLLLWGLHRIGVNGPLALGVLLTAISCLTVPLVAVAVRSLCHEPAARRLLPLLVLAPYALWVAVSMDGVTTAVAAGAITLGVVGSEPHRSPWWAVGAGFLLGLAALFSYSVAWLAVTVVAVYFVRRRPLLNFATGGAALVPLFLAQLGGFVWSRGLTAAQADFSIRVGPHHSWAIWIALDLLVLVIACGPAVVPAARKFRLTPGWPFLVGAVLGVGFALASGLSRGEVERSWLAFFPWLLVPAVAPETHESGELSSATPGLLLVLAAVTSIVLAAMLRSPW